MKLIITIGLMCLGSILSCYASEVWVGKDSLTNRDLERDLHSYNERMDALSGYKERGESEASELRSKGTLSIEEAAKLRRYDTYLANLQKERSEVERSLEAIRAEIEKRSREMACPIPIRPKPIRLPH